MGSSMSFTLLWNDEPFYYCIIWIYPLSDGGWFLYIASLRSHWVPVNLFLLSNWVFTLVLRSLVRLIWSGWKWGCFKILFGACDLTFTYYFYFLFWGSCDGRLWFEILVIQVINCSGHLKVRVRVLLCFTYCFVMPKFKFVILVRLTIMAIGFLGF